MKRLLSLKGIELMEEYDDILGFSNFAFTPEMRKEDMYILLWQGDGKLNNGKAEFCTEISMVLKRGKDVHIFSFFEGQGNFNDLYLYRFIVDIVDIIKLSPPDELILNLEDAAWNYLPSTRMPE